MIDLFFGHRKAKRVELPAARKLISLSGIYGTEGWVMVEDILLKIGESAALKILNPSGDLSLDNDERLRQEGRLRAIREFFSTLNSIEKEVESQQKEGGG